MTLLDESRDKRGFHEEVESLAAAAAEENVMVEVEEEQGAGGFCTKMKIGLCFAKGANYGQMQGQGE